MIKLKNLPERMDILYGHRIDGVFSVTGTVHVIRDEAELPFFREGEILVAQTIDCLLYTSPSPRDGLLSRMPSSA